MKTFGKWFGEQGQVSDPAPEPDLPEGLFLVNGVVSYHCRICDEKTRWEGAIDEFDIDSSENMCGGSPRCCP